MPVDETTRTEHGDDPLVLDPEAISEERDALGVGAGDAPPGTYVLIFGVDPAATIDVGALGTVEFPSGAYAYVGSAFGSNGLGRVDRHRRVAEGSHDVRHWHVDYLGGHAGTGRTLTGQTAPLSRYRGSAPPTVTVRHISSAARTPIPSGRPRSTPS